MAKDHLNQLWYTRRHNEIRGPFPAGMVTRHILLGRILETDELSIDQTEWKTVASIAELIPEVMKNDLSIAENQAELEISIRREDERQHGDRRRFDDNKDFNDDIRFKRKGDERRETESMDLVRHREIKTAINESFKVKPERFGIRSIWLFSIVCAVIWVAIVTTPTDAIVSSQCQSEPGPNVDWRQCRKEGISLVNMNLAGATMQGASMSGANLSKATLVAANLSYVNFANSQFANANLQQANLVGTVFRNADLTNVDFTEANLSYAVLNGANLSGANFTNANLTHAILNDADISNIKLTGTMLDKAIWVDNSVCAPESLGSCIKIK